MALGDALAEEGELDETEGSHTEDEAEEARDDSAVLLGHFQDAGLLYTEEGDDNWVIFLARTLNSKLKVSEIRSDGVTITWNASPPADEDIIAVQDITSLQASEMSLHKSLCSLFIPSPWPISQDSSKIKKGLSPKPPSIAKWLVITVPFERENEDLKIEMSPLRVERN